MSLAPSPELTVLGLAAILQAAQIGVAALAVARDMGPGWSAGPRDTEPQYSPLTGRLRRAVGNHFEALILFTVAVVLVGFTQSGSALTAGAAWVYLAARLLYVPAYAFGWSPGRSIVFGLGFAATFVMIVAALL